MQLGAFLIWEYYLQRLMPVDETETSASHPVLGVPFQTRSNPEEFNNVIKR